MKGKMAILTRTDGSLVSIPVEDIDLGKTAAAAAVKPAAPKTEPKPAAPKKPTTPAEAARAKGGKRATVVITDDDVGTSTPVGPDGEKVEKGDGEVSIANANATRTTSGYSIKGSVINVGKADVRGVSVTIEAVGENSKAMQTVFGNVAKDNLAPGEKSAFTAEVTSEAEAKSFRYVPSWQLTVSVKTAEPGSASKSETGSSSPKPSAPSEPNPGSRPKAENSEPPPQPTPQVIPRPDVAPPSASAPIGAPSAPGGVYIPRPSDNQPGQPKTP
ncbi:MAG TPA: FxLYD domain-containing protein [Thermoanaerobaculia bacterium]